MPQPQKLCLEVHPGMCEDYTSLKKYQLDGLPLNILNLNLNAKLEQYDVLIFVFVRDSFPQS